MNSEEQKLDLLHMCFLLPFFEETAPGGFLRMTEAQKKNEVNKKWKLQPPDDEPLEPENTGPPWKSKINHRHLPSLSASSCSSSGGCM